MLFAYGSGHPLRQPFGFEKTYFAPEPSFNINTNQGELNA